MAYLVDLTTQRDALLTAYSVALAAGPSHTVSSKNGSTTFDNGGYLKTLSEEIQKLNELISAADPFDFGTRHYL